MRDEQRGNKGDHLRNGVGLASSSAWCINIAAKADSSGIIPAPVAPATSFGLIDILVVERMEKGRPVLLMIIKGL